MYSYNAHLSFVEHFVKSAVTYLIALNMQLPEWNDWIVKAILFDLFLAVIQLTISITCNWKFLKSNTPSFSCTFLVSC
jgi:hypothetical protein